MTDLRCLSCDEPWEAHHLRYEAIHETDYEPGAVPWDGRLTDALRAAFARAGYGFGKSLYVLRTCPCCPPERDPEPARPRALLAEIAATLLAGDPDGLAVAISELPE